MKIHFLAAPVAILVEKGRLAGIRCIRMELGEPDASGRRRPMPKKGSEFVMKIDTAVIALGTTTNSFSISGDGSRPTSTLGNAMGFCNALNTANFAGHNDWYLPTQKQLMQAYIDGSANNLSNPNYYFWSATEHYNDPTKAWNVNLNNGNTNNNTKVTGNNVRCVRP